MLSTHQRQQRTAIEKNSDQTAAKQRRVATVACGASHTNRATHHRQTCGAAAAGPGQPKHQTTFLRSLLRSLVSDVESKSCGWRHTLRSLRGVAPRLPGSLPVLKRQRPADEGQTVPDLRNCPQIDRGRQRSGQALIEFAFLLPLLVILIGATLSFGLFFFQANTLQQGVDVAAQEISRMPFAPTAELGLGDLSAANTAVMYDSNFQSQIYDEQFLVIHDSEWAAGTTANGDYRAYVDTLPLLNRLLATVMVRDATFGAGVTRFPGAIVANSITGEETVLVPIIGYNADGTETLVEWVAPVEEIRPGGGQGPFSLTATNSAASFVPGMVALRINYPAQSTTLVNRTGDRGQVIIRADDSSLGGDGDTGSNYSLVVGAESGPADTTINSGRYGLGRQAALFEANGIRPYRKVMSVQAIYRREVFQ